MKRILLSLCSLFLAQAFVALAQETVAPNHYQAHPSKFKKRLQTIKGYYGSTIKYLYDANNLLAEEVCTVDGYNDQVAYRIKYVYDDKNYLIRKENYGRIVYVDGQPQLQLNFLHEFMRDENSYVTSYQRSALKDDGQTLAVDIKIDFEYNEKKLLSKAAIDFLMPTKRYTSIEYDDQNRLSVMQQIDHEQLIEKEELFYNDKGRIERKTLWDTSQGQYALVDVTKYIYDDNDDIIKVQPQQADFIQTYAYDAQQLASETFFPRATIAELVLYGPKNTLLLSLPLDNSFRHAPIKQEASDTNLIYEDTTPTSIESVEANNTKAVSYRLEGKTLRVELLREKFASDLQVFDMQGRMLTQLPLQSNSLAADLSHLPSAVYVIKLGAFTAKIAL